MTTKQQKRARALKDIFDQLILHLAAQGLPTMTYKDLGEQMDLGKSAISNLLNGTYNSATAGKYLERLAEYLSRYCAQANFTPELSRSARASLTQQPPVSGDEGVCRATVRVSLFGFFRFNGKHYHCSSQAGKIITVEPGDEPETANVLVAANKSATVCLTLRPIDPTHSQLPAYGTSHGARRTGGFHIPRTTPPPRGVRTREATH